MRTGTLSILDRFMLGLLACGVVIGLVAFLSQAPEPAYQGKSLKDWINIYLWPFNPTSGDLFRHKLFLEGQDVRQQEAAEAIRHIGTNAIPTLLAWEDKDFQLAWKVKLGAALPKFLRNWHPVEWWLVEQDHYRVDRAICGFRLLGSNASPAVPELTRRLMTRNSASGRSAAAALANIGGVALPALLSALTNPGTPSRAIVARCAADATRAASNDISGIVVLARCVRDADPAVGATAAMELGYLTTQPGITVPALLEGLKAPNGLVRARSAEALGRSGAQARSAVPALLEYRGDADSFVRQSVSNALEQLTSGPE